MVLLTIKKKKKKKTKVISFSKPDFKEFRQYVEPQLFIGVGQEGHMLDWLDSPRNGPRSW